MFKVSKSSIFQVSSPLFTIYGQNVSSKILLQGQVCLPGAMLFTMIAMDSDHLEP